MTTDIDPAQVALRLSLTAVAAALIGFERETNNRPAGLRTTLLVSLAACISMIQADALLTVRGKAPDSYVVLDLMRLPLGILSGMGFIGAGAILRKDNIVVGVTTAATLWFVTVMGLCFGGGQLGLGATAAILAIFILQGLRFVEHRWQRDQKATLRLVLVIGSDGFDEVEISRLLKEKGCRVGLWSVSSAKDSPSRSLVCQVHWRSGSSECPLPPFVDDLTRRPEVLSLDWQREGSLKPD